MSSTNNLLGSNVIVTPPDGAKWDEFTGRVRSVYVGGDRMRLVVENPDGGSLQDVPAHACAVLPKDESEGTEGDPGMLTNVALAALDYVMQNPELDEGNEYQAELIVRVRNWRQLSERSLWATDLCSAGECAGCHHEECECPHHTGVEPK